MANQKQKQFDLYFMRIAREVSTKSKCMSRKIGAVLVKDKAIISCYDKNTEVLTKNGFKLFKNLSKNDEVATLDNKLHLKFYKPNKVIKQRYRGKLYLLDTKYINLCVTPNHKMFVSRDKVNWELIEAQSLYKLPITYNRQIKWKGNKLKWIKLKGFNSNNQYPSEMVRIPIKLWLEFLGYYIAEGFCINYRNWRKVCIATNYKDKYHKDMLNCCLKIAKLLNRRISKDGRGRIIINDRRLYNKLCFLGKSHEKYIERDLLNLTPDLLKILLLSLMRGDGKFTLHGGVYTTVSEKLANNFQELALKCGYSAIKGIRKKPTKAVKIENRILKKIRKSYYVCITDLHLTPTINTLRTKKSIEKWIDYNGHIYCVNVKNHIVFVRRNGKCCWSGNTGYNGPPRGVRECNERSYQFYRNLFDIPNKVENTPIIKCPRRMFGYNSGKGLHLCQAGHAERNALIQAGRNGISTLGTTLYCYCSLPCKDCMIEIINAGVETLVYLDDKVDYDNYSRILLEESFMGIRKIKVEEL